VIIELNKQHFKKRDYSGGATPGQARANLCPGKKAIALVVNSPAKIKQRQKVPIVMTK